ncbi:MAG: pseudouridine synthase [Flavobacteriaceae bacterium]|nr:pseudouridine synthase [Flavobacteriaceae bacterium]
MHRHFKIYKPYGVLSQFISNAKDQRRKRFLGELYDFPKGSMAIGRLDEKSEGLLLITTDGKLSTQITSAKVEKEYYALVDGIISDKAIAALSCGVEIGFEGKKYITKPCKVQRLQQPPRLPERSKKIRDARHGPVSWISMILKEGKFRQVRKMTSAVGHPTLRLVRIRVGYVTLDAMNASDVIEIDANDVLI